MPQNRNQRKEDIIVTWQISDAELEIMKIIWSNNEPTLFAQIMDVLEANEKSWQKNTVITLLSRLMGKGYLKANKLGRKNEYVALISEADYQSAQTRAFIDKVYEGNTTGLIARLVQSEILTDEEYAELKKILEVK